MSLILVIDDELAITELLEAVLSYEDFQVITAHNGKAGLTQLAAHPVDLILCDLMMPLMDGWEVCRAVQGDPQYHHIPIVLMSAAREATLAGDCRYTAFMTKPFDIDALLALVTQSIGRPPPTQTV